MGSSRATRRQVRMESRVETGHLRKRRIPALHGLDQFHLHRQMLGGKQDDFAQIGRQFRRNSLGLVVARPAMHDAMANGEQKYTWLKNSKEGRSVHAHRRGSARRR